MKLNAAATAGSTEAFARPALTLESIHVDARLTRRQAAKALTDCGIPLSPDTLATKASRGGGPPYQLFGKIAIYTWGPLVAWSSGVRRGIAAMAHATLVRCSAALLAGDPSSASAQGCQLSRRNDGRKMLFKILTVDWQE